VLNIVRKEIKIHPKILNKNNFLYDLLGPGGAGASEEALPHQEQDPGPGGTSQQQEAPGIHIKGWSFSHHMAIYLCLFLNFRILD